MCSRMNNGMSYIVDTTATLVKSREEGIDVNTQEVKDGIRECIACQAFHPLKKKASYGIHSSTKKPGEYICIDFIGHIKKHEGKGWILVIMDMLSKFAYKKELRKVSGTQIMDSIKEWSQRYGYPYNIHCDRASYFQEKQLDQWLNELSVCERCRVPNDHRSNGDICLH